MAQVPCTATASLLAPLSLACCGALDFDVQQNIPEQRVSGSVVSALLVRSFKSVSLTIDLAQETKARGTGPVKAAGLKSLSFQITNMASGSVHDFSFVQTVEIYMKALKVRHHRSPARRSPTCRPAGERRPRSICGPFLI